jgi:hypothetical protein
MTLVNVVWLVALWLVLVGIALWERYDTTNGRTPSLVAIAARKVCTWIVVTGVVLWALLLFRALNAFGEIRLP